MAAGSSIVPLGVSWWRRVVDRDLLRRKSARVLHHVARLRDRTPVMAQTLSGDEDLANLVAMDLQQAIQGCIDLALHVCVDEELGAPAGAGAAFALLARRGLISEQLLSRLLGACALRNIIVHQYIDPDFERLCAVVRDDLGDLESFIAALNRHADRA